MYLITAEALVDEADLDPDDTAIAGRYVVQADDEDDALDQFHQSFGIAVVENFEISVEQISTTDPRIDDAIGV